MPIPDAAKAKFDNAYAQVSPAPPQITPGEAAVRSAVANVNMTEGFLISLEALEQRFSADTAQAIASVAAAIDRYETATTTGAASMERWTKAQTITAVVLAFFTAVQVAVAVLEYLK